MAKQTFSVGQVLTAAQMTSLQETAMGGGAASAKTASYTLVAADAGTTISMTSTSATTITVNTGLFAAGDTVFIQNLGSANCTITAGTATVNTASSLALAQHESGTLYFTSAGASTFYKSAGAVASSGGITLLSTTTLSGSSTTISSISQSYKNLYGIVYGLSYGTSNNEFVMLPNNDASSAFFNGVGASASSTVAAFGVNAQSIWLTGNPTNSLRTSTENAWTFEIQNYTAGSLIPKTFNVNGKFRDSGNTFEARQFSQGGIIGVGAITSLVFKTLSGYTLNSGTVLLYGVN